MSSHNMLDRLQKNKQKKKQTHSFAYSHTYNSYRGYICYMTACLSRTVVLIKCYSLCPERVWARRRGTMSGSTRSNRPVNPRAQKKTTKKNTRLFINLFVHLTLWNVQETSDFLFSQHPLSFFARSLLTEINLSR